MSIQSRKNLAESNMFRYSSLRFDLTEDQIKRSIESGILYIHYSGKQIQAAEKLLSNPDFIEKITINEAEVSRYDILNLCAVSRPDICGSGKDWTRWAEEWENEQSSSVENLSNKYENLFDKLNGYRAFEKI